MFINNLLTKKEIYRKLAKYFLVKYITEHRKATYKPYFDNEILDGKISEDLMKWSKEMDMLINAYNILSEYFKK